MNLKDFLANRDKPPELYWSLVIEKGWAQSGIWYIGEGSAEVIALSPPAAWEVEEELVGACDAALSSAVAKLPENYDEPNKTVFGVPSSWVKGGEIEDKHIAKIKKVCTELSLTPVGFVVLPEAIAHLFKSEDGTPLSAVIVGLGKEELEVSVFKLGNLAGSTTVARSVSITDDVKEGLSRFEGAAPLPSRIIVYDGRGGELEEAKEELTKNDWDVEGAIKFLHTPKVETLVSDRKVLATSLAGAAEIANINKVTAPEAEEKPVEATLPPAVEIENVALPEDLSSAEELGFMIDEDVSLSEKPDFELPESPVTVKEPEPPLPEHHIRHHQSEAVNHVSNAKKLFHGFSSKVKLPSYNTAAIRKPNPILIILGSLILLVVLTVTYISFVPKAEVTIFVAPKSYQEQVTLTFSTDGAFDLSKGIIPATLVSSSATGDKTKSTTGTKLVGERATGSVQIANGNGNPINLAAGTVLTSTSGLKFVTASEASVSGQLIPGSPGTATLTVTAQDIGAQYNLAKGEIFKVGVFDKSQVAATSQTDFSGGSSQQIAAVSEADQKSLEADLKAELTAQVEEEVGSQVTENQIFVNDLSSVGATSQSFDKKVGDVASTLKLSLTVTANGVAADKSKLLEYATASLQSKIPQGFALRNSQISFKFKYAGTGEGNLTYTTDISANFLPMVDTDELQKKVAGKSIPAVEEYLTSVPGYARAEVKLNPHLPGPLSLLPRVKKNISIEVTSDR
jgi:hypothetical protein